MKAMTANNENLKLTRQMETLNRKLEEMERENNEIETENKKMQKTIETLKLTSRRVNQLETENLDLEGKHHKVERENKSLVREIERLRQTLEVKDLSLDENASKLAVAERELEKDKFLYYPDMNCSWHEETTDTRHCSSARVRSWIYTLLDVCCHRYNIDLLPLQHYPPLQALPC